MTRVHPFHPYRFAAQSGPLASLLTQPYDKISPDMQQRYLAANPRNIVRIILGERRPSDTDSDNVYTRGGTLFGQWIADGTFVREPRAALFPYFQRFQIVETGETLTRQGFIALGPVEPYSSRVVHRHEQTLSGPKKDRLHVLEHTGAHFGQIFMLYPDREGAVDQILAHEMTREKLCEVQDEYGVTHTLGRIDNPDRIAEIQRLMADRKLLIADGHHRYETALAFREKNQDLPGAAAVMMTFVNMHSVGLRILATHRLVSGLTDFSRESLRKRVAPPFSVRELDSLEELQAAWREAQADTIRIGVAFAESSKLLLLERRRDELQSDVAVLHREILENALGISAEAVREEKHLRYIRGADVALGEVRKGAAQVAFLLEPTSIDQVAEVSFAGGVMPQKSTDFYPKLLTGLTIYRLADGL
jgi:uncharacterized protein (DUF1015 family)